MLKFLLDIIAPKRCLVCKCYWKYVCDECYEKIRDFENICYVCKNRSTHFEVHNECRHDIFYDKVIILKHYKAEKFWQIIKQAKFYHKKEVFRELVEYLYEAFLIHQKIRKKEDFCIVSVPGYWIKRLKRDYNSSEVLAQYFSKISGIPYRKNVIKKIKNTLQQSKLDRKKRLANLKNSFIIKNSSYISWKKILIIDDVISTGTTINEISRILKQEGVNEIIGLCLASN